MAMGIVNINVEDEVPISRFLPHILPRKSTTKVTKDPYSFKFKVFSPLILDELPIEGDLFSRVSFLNMEDLDLGDHAKFP